jgi:hypothetical protein
MPHCSRSAVSQWAIPDRTPPRRSKYTDDDHEEGALLRHPR